MNLNLDRSSRVKPGVYKVRIEEVDDTQAGPSGFLNIKLTYQIISSSGKPTGRQLFDNLSMSPKARFNMDNFLDAINAPEEGNVSPRSFKGKSLWVQVDKRKNNRGEIVPDVVGYLTEEAMKTIEATEVADVEISDDDYSAPRDFRPSASLDDDGEEGEEDSQLENVMDGNDEDIPF